MSDWESPPKSKTPVTDAGWESPSSDGPAVPFVSGQMFKDTLEIPHNLKNATADNPNEGLEDKFYRGIQNVGGAVLDTAAALPAMVAGGVHGIYDGLMKGDATAGFKTGSETMQKFMPTTLMNKVVPNFTDTKSVGYQLTMAPVTVAMDTMNAVPTTFGEILNHAGFPDAAAQVEAGGKLALMTILGAKGAKEAYKAITGKEAKNAQEAADKLEKIKAAIEAQKAAKQAETKPTNQNGAYDKGIPGTWEDPQGQLFSEKEPTPTNPIPGDSQMGLFDKPAEPLETIPYEHSLMEKGQETAQPGPGGADSLQMPMVPDRLELMPKEEPAASVPQEPAPIIEGNKTAEQAAYEQSLREHAAQKQAQIESIYGDLERQKAMDHGRMEGQRELDLNESLRNITDRSTMRRAFLDKANLDFKHLEENVKDASLMGQEHTIEMRANLRNGNVRGALDVLANQHPIAAYRELAKYLSDKVDGLFTKLHDESTIRMGDRDVTGYYDPQTHTVGLSGLGANSPHTVLHELAHAVTSHFINTNPKDMRVTGLKALFKAMGNEKGMRKFPGIVNVKEFVAEAFSNPKFQEFLKGVCVNNKSVWRRFVDGVKSMLGLAGDTPMVTAFEHAMDLGKQVVEAQTGKAEVREKLTNAGLSNKLADLMASKPEDVRSDTGPTKARDEAISKMSGAAQALKDYIPENFSMDQIREAARMEKDVDQNVAQKFINNFTSGGLYQSLKTKNLIVKKTYESIGFASDRAQSLINKYVKDKETGILAASRALSAKESTQAVMTRLVMDAGQEELSGHKLAEAGMNEKQIAWIMKARDTMDAALKSVNESRAAAGLKPVDRRLGYAVSRTLGDFRKMVFEDVPNAKGELVRTVVGQVAASTRAELRRIERQVSEAAPHYTMGEEKYMGQGAHKDNAGTRQSYYREAMQALVDGDPRAENFMKVLSDTYVGDAYDYMNAKRHTLVKKGIFGSEGREAWKTPHENAVNFMKAEVTYAETMFRWGELSKAVEELNPLLSDETIKQPNAKDWADRYIDQAMGINPTKIGKAVNDFIGAVGDTSGTGSKNINNFGSDVKGLTNTILLGLNPMYMAINLLQPLQGMPVIKALVKSRGLETRFDGGTGYTYLVQGLMSSLRDRTGGKLGGKMNEFEHQMTQYGKDHQIFGNEILDHSSQVQNNFAHKASKLTDFGINAIESNTNRVVFSGISHMLKEAGMKTSEGLFETAFKLTKEVMHDYRPIEAPMGFQNFGTMGNLAKNLTKYKTGEMSKLAAMVREIPDNGSWNPLLVTVASQVAFAGMLGITGMHEADQLFQYITKKMGKPMTLAGLIMKFPELMSHGIGSLAGLDLSNRLGMGELLPNSVWQAFFGGASKITDVLGAGFNAATHPSEMNTKRLIREAAPGVLTGPMDRKWFSTTNQEGQEMGISRRPSDFHNIEGQVPRNDADKFWKTLGATGVHESREKAKAYDRSVVSGNYRELRKGVVTELADSIFTNKGQLNQEMLNRARSRYIKYEGDPNAFASEVQHEIMAQKTDAETREKLRNAQGGVTGAYNLQRMFEK